MYDYEFTRFANTTLHCTVFQYWHFTRDGRFQIPPELLVQSLFSGSLRYRASSVQVRRQAMRLFDGDAAEEQTGALGGGWRKVHFKIVLLYS